MLILVQLYMQHR